MKATPDVIPWGWQDTATLVTCAFLLMLAFLLARRVKARTTVGCHGCSPHGPATLSPRAAKVVIPTAGLRLGQRTTAASGARGADRPGREHRLEPERPEDDDTTEQRHR